MFSSKLKITLGYSWVKNVKQGRLKKKSHEAAYVGEKKAHFNF